MKWRHANHAREHYQNAPTIIQKAFDKQVRLLLVSLRHPSLHAKKYGGVADLWQARITKDWRFYFHIDGDEYVIIAIQQHPQ